MREVLYIAAKQPCAGEVKTRLAASIGAQAAADLYAAFLADLNTTFSNVSFQVCWYISGANGWARPHLKQKDGDWSQRQAALFAGMKERGEDRVLLVASDSPQLSSVRIREAFDLLGRFDLVLGPVLDGGYYLIGMRDWHDVFAGTRMTSATTAEDILVRAAELGLSIALLEPTFDVDEVADLRLLSDILDQRPDLEHSRAALARIMAGSLP
jgi:rSAM/selenodomain-associated transferase 1